jgi:FkbH-like protein
MKLIREYLSAIDVDNLASLLSGVNHVSSADASFKTSVNINFLRNFTVEGIEPYLKYYLFMSDIRPKITFGNYDTVRQDVLDESSHLHASSPDIAILSLILEQLDPECINNGWSAEKVKNEIPELFNLTASRTNALIAVNTFVPPFYSKSGIASSSALSDQGEQIAGLNKLIKDYVKKHSNQFFLIDWERLVRVLGEDKSIDYRYWYMSRSRFKKDFLKLYANEIAKIIKALKGHTKKCLVLDCDNTLWGGVVGEDGLHGIKLDRNDYPGKIYYDFQMSVLHLIERGALVTLCSKNNEDDVWDVLDNHPSGLIKRNYLSGWRINWENKVDNITSLADELNIGIDSMVFVDDDPSECEMIRRYLPEVTVLQVPGKLYNYPHLLFKEGLFDALYLSKEDRERPAMYQAEARRKREKVRFANLENYLASLELKATISPVKSHEIPRVAQLTQKTNQFNLTTRRYSEKDVTVFSNDPGCAVYTLSARDKYGDYGLTGVLIAKNENGKGIIDSLLLSCRILGRKLEVALVTYCIRKIEEEWDIAHWNAKYIPTVKNKQTADFWNKIGFTQVKNTSESKSYFLKNGALKKEDISFIEVIDG